MNDRAEKPANQGVLESVSIEVPVVSPSQRLRRKPSPPAVHPRLGPAHLLLWVTMVCLYFAMAQNLIRDQQKAMLGVLILVAQAMLAGIAWSGLSITLSRSWRLREYLVEPGEWLMVAVAVRLAVEQMLQLSAGRIFVTPSAVAGISTCCCLVLPTLSRRLPQAWKVLFLVLVVLHCAPWVLACCPSSWGVTRYLSVELIARSSLAVSLTVPPVLATWSRYRGEQSSWLHWSGVCVWSLWLLMQPRVMGWLWG